MRHLIVLPVIALVLAGSGTPPEAAAAQKVKAAALRAKRSGAKRSWRQRMGLSNFGLRKKSFRANFRRGKQRAERAENLRPASQLKRGAQIARGMDGKATRAKKKSALRTLVKRTIIGAAIATPSVVGYLALGPIGVVVGPVATLFGVAFFYGHLTGDRVGKG